MPERPADILAGKRNFVRKFDLDDAGHDTRVVTTLGVADDEDWFAKGTALSADINWLASRHIPLPNFRHEHFAAPAADPFPAAATRKSLDEKDEGENNEVESGDKNDPSGDNDVSDGDKKDPADTTDSDNKVNGGETDDKNLPEDTKKPSNDTEKAPDKDTENTQGGDDTKDAPEDKEQQN